MSSINKSVKTSNYPQTATKSPVLKHDDNSSNNNTSNRSTSNNTSSDSSTNSIHKKHKRHRSRKKNRSTLAKKHSNMSSNELSNDLPLIPSNIDIRDAYKRKKLKHILMHNLHICIDIQIIQHLKQLLGRKKCQMYGQSNNELFNKCVVCEEICIEGEMAVETVLFIPKKNNPSFNNLGRFRCKLPRICCWDCCKEDGYELPHQPPSWKSMANVWKSLITNADIEPKETLAINMQNISGDSNTTYISYGSNSEIIPPSTTSNSKISYNTSMGNQPSLSPMVVQQKQSNVQFSSSPFINHHTSPTMMVDAGVGGNAGLMPNESENDPFDDGFLICTQLVKTGGADQGGLQVGDVFVQFGMYSKTKFPGLKSIANLVRRSAGKEINAIVWRKLEQTGGEDEDGSGRTVFQKLALKLRPLQSHDADGGGVLGSVVNSYPLPEMHN